MWHKFSGNPSYVEFTQNALAGSVGQSQLFCQLMDGKIPVLVKKLTQTTFSSVLAG
jgi:hypothetical protein